MQSPNKKDDDKSEFLDALKKGVLLGAAVLAVALPAMWVMKHQRPAQPPVAVQQPAPQQQAPAAVPAQPPVAQAPAAPAAPSEPEKPRLADFKGENATPDVQLVANWSAHTRDHKKRGFVIIDKKDAHLYVFDKDAKLLGQTPILLGSAKGDDSAPGVGNKPLSQVKPHEKTTPAGRFVAEMGKNTHGEDIIWIDYEAAVSMHRLRKVAEKERRYERMASPTKADNRISFGCVNIPVQFYEGILDPMVKKIGAVVYVLPETKTIQHVLGAYDVTQPQQVAQAPTAPQRQ